MVAIAMTIITRMRAHSGHELCQIHSDTTHGRKTIHTITSHTVGRAWIQRQVSLRRPDEKIHIPTYASQRRMTIGLVTLDICPPDTLV